MEKDCVRQIIDKIFDAKKKSGVNYIGIGHILYAFISLWPNTLHINVDLNISKNETLKLLNEYNKKRYASFSKNKEELSKDAKSFLNFLNSNYENLKILSERNQIEVIASALVSLNGMDEFFTGFINFLTIRLMNKYSGNNVDSSNDIGDFENDLRNLEDEDKPFNYDIDLDKIKGLYNVNERVYERQISIIGRNRETEEAFTTLSKKNKANVLLLGEAGVGKTAIVEKMAEMINNGNVLDNFKNHIIYELSVSELLAGTKYRGDFEEKFTKILNAVIKKDNIILFIDEIHNAVKAGAGEDSTNSVMEMLKPYLGRGTLRVIGATTYDEYRRIFSKNKATERRFETINVLEPTKEETLGILKGMKASYEGYHNIDIPDEIIPLIVDYSEKYISNKKFPDKALDILDYICARAKNDQIVINQDLVKTAIEKVANVKLESNLTKEDFEQKIKKVIKGQDNTISEVSEIINLLNLGIVDKNKPLASFLLTGPTGTGKTELAKQIAKIYFGSADRLIKIDMSDYPEKHDAAKLTGATPGYVGYDDGSLLLNSVKKQPYSVILLDEIEKAHPDVLNIFLQILDDGFLCSADGEKVDFRNTMIIMTSNLGFHQSDSKMISLAENSDNSNKKVIELAIKNFLKPEFLNRIDKIIYFNKLNKDVIKEIAENYMSNFGEYTLTDEELELLMEEAEVDTYGARAVQKVVKTKILPNKVIKKEVTLK